MRTKFAFVFTAAAAIVAFLAGPAGASITNGH